MNVYYEEPRYSFRPDRITWAVQTLILINVACFAAQLLLHIPLGGYDPNRVVYDAPGGIISDLLAFQPGLFLRGFVWQPFAYMFLHANLPHLFFNMIWLFFFGPEVERTLGSRQFTYFYLLCGAVGVLATMTPWIMSRVLWLMHADPHMIAQLRATASVRVVGASGALSGVLIAFAVIDPERQVFLFPIPFPINARALVIIVIVWNLLMGLGGGGGNVSVLTHLGGMGVGYLYMKLIPKWRHHQLRKRRNGSDGELGDAVNRIFERRDRGFWKK